MSYTATPDPVAAAEHERIANVKYDEADRARRSGSKGVEAGARKDAAFHDRLAYIYRTGKEPPR